MILPKRQTCWMAPIEREQLITSDENTYTIHQWIQFSLPFLNKTLNIRTVKSKVALLDSHVGEELWDAAKLFCAHLCRTAMDDRLCGSKEEERICDGKRLRGKRILELGAGVGSLGMCVAALGANQVLCTDYDKDVLDNLHFNLCQNIHIVCPKEEECNQPLYYERRSRLSFSELDWRSFAAKDIRDISWLVDSEIPSTARRSNSIGAGININFCMEDFEPDILIGSALIYSAQGALHCADTICFYLMEKRAKECWILQMPDRPGFDRFLMRLEDRGLVYECSGLCEETFRIAERHMGNIHSTKDDFKMYVIHLKETSCF